MYLQEAQPTVYICSMLLCIYITAGNQQYVVTEYGSRSNTPLDTSWFSQQNTPSPKQCTCVDEPGVFHCGVTVDRVPTPQTV